MSRFGFLTLLAGYDVSVLQDTPESLEEELRHAGGQDHYEVDFGAGYAIAYV